MSGRRIQNARISSASLRVDRGFAITIWIFVQIEGGGQGFGGYLLSHMDRDPSPHLAAWITGLFKLFEVETLEALKGEPCRVDADFGRIYRIGHLLRDDWFDPEEINARCGQ